MGGDEKSTTPQPPSSPDAEQQPHEVPVPPSEGITEPMAEASATEEKKAGIDITVTPIVINIGAPTPTVLTDLLSRFARIRQIPLDDPQRSRDAQQWQQEFQQFLSEWPSPALCAEAKTALASRNMDRLIELIERFGPRVLAHTFTTVPSAIDEAMVSIIEGWWIENLLDAESQGGKNLESLCQVLSRSISRNVAKTTPLSLAETKSLWSGLSLLRKNYVAALAVSGSSHQAYVSVVERLCRSKHIKERTRKERILKAFDEWVEKETPELKEKIATKCWHALLADKP